MAADFSLVLAHYRMTYPTLASLGAGDPPVIWHAEYTRVAQSGFSATLITGSSTADSSAQGQRNFPQTMLLRGLLTRRAELDPAFDDSVFAPVKTKRRQRLGTIVRLGRSSGSYQTLSNN